MRKPAFCICENKEADQLRGSREADQRLCFRYLDSTIPLLFKLLNIFRGCTARSVSVQVKNPENWFSHNEAQMPVYTRVSQRFSHDKEQLRLAVSIEFD